MVETTRRPAQHVQLKMATQPARNKYRNVPLAIKIMAINQICDYNLTQYKFWYSRIDLRQNDDEINKKSSTGIKARGFKSPIY